MLCTQSELILEIRARRCAYMNNDIGPTVKSKLASKLRRFDSYGWTYTPGSPEAATLAQLSSEPAAAASRPQPDQDDELSARRMVRPCPCGLASASACSDSCAA